MFKTISKYLLFPLAIWSLSLYANAAGTVKLGVILGFTGPIESLTPNMARSAELAWQEVSDSKIFLGGKKIKSVRANSTCIDSAAASTNAERLITSEKVVAIYGADCSGVTTAIANNVAIPNGVVMVSPSATSPALSTINDHGYFFRTSPSDARQGEILADLVFEKGIKNVAITYTNNDYGKGLSDSFSSAYKNIGGSVAISTSHEDGKSDYSAEVATLSASGANHLVVLGYLDKGGKGIIQSSIDTDAFSKFILADGMIGQSLVDAIGADLEGTIGTVPGSESSGSKKFNSLTTVAGYDGNGPYRASSYDAGALIALAIQAAGNTSRQGVRDNMMKVANRPGEKIYPGQLAKALKILAAGGDIDYEGATDVEFNDVGEVFGTYKILVVKGQEFKTVEVR